MKRLEISFGGGMIGVTERVVSPKEKEELVKELESLLNEFLEKKEKYIKAIKELYKKYEKLPFEKDWRERLKEILTDWKGYALAIILHIPLVIITKRFELYHSIEYLITALSINAAEEILENASGEAVDELEERKKKKEFIERNIEKIIRCIGDKYYPRVSEIVNKLLENYVEHMNKRELRIIFRVIKDFLIPYTSIVPELYLDYQRYVRTLKYINNLINKKKKDNINVINTDNRIFGDVFNTSYLQVII